MMRCNNTISNHAMPCFCKGVTLIEILVGLVLGLVLMGGLIQIYLGSKQSYRIQEAHSRLQENARFAIELLTRDIRMAGYAGCLSSIPVINSTLNATPATLTPRLIGIQGWEANTTGSGSVITLTTNVTPVTVAIGASANQWSTSAGNTLEATKAVPNSDILRIWRGSETVAVINNVSGTPTVINTTANSDASTGDILLLSDCRSADWVQACIVTGTTSKSHTLSALGTGCSPGNNTTQSVLTGTGGELVKLISNIYYIGKRGDDPNNPTSLFRRALANNATAGNAEELVEGVENMQILYGEDTDAAPPDGVANYYVSANDVNTWNNVVSVRISLLMQTMEDNLAAAPQAIQFNGNTVNTPDNRLRRVFTTTIGVRNRLP